MAGCEFDYHLGMKTFQRLTAALTFALIFVLSCLAISASAQTATPSVSLQVARDALQNATAVVIDIREPGEHATGVASGARLLPMSQLSKRISEIPKTADQPVLLICNTQNRSARVAEQLRAAGYTHVSYVNGGMAQWAQQQWPMVKPQANKAMTP